jgi:hypothetical protein
MGTTLEVQVLLFSDHRDQSEAQLREGNRAWEGSVERTCGVGERVMRLLEGLYEKLRLQINKSNNVGTKRRCRADLPKVR